ncbi:MAG: thiamine pyrophosphate-dependent enzyme, partial [Pseudomonadales bacterium]
ARSRNSLISRPGPDQALIEQAAASLIQARAPLLLVGGGAVAAADPILALAERLDSPVLNTVNGKGICPATHPLAVGGSPSLACLRSALQTADVVLAIGTEMAETDYDLLMEGPLPTLQNLIRMDIDPEQLRIPARPAMGITTDAGLGATALLTALVDTAPAQDSSAENTRGALAGAHRAATLRTAIEHEPHFHSEIQDFLCALQRAAPDAILVGDSTRPTYYAAWQYECLQPRSYFHSVSGFGTLGYALPAAFGAALGTKRPVVGLIGDGGIQFTLPELTTGSELQLGVPIIIWHNDGYREIENSMRAKNIAADSTRILAPDFQAAALAHHVNYANPQSLGDLEQVIGEAIGVDKPTLVEVRESDFLSQPSGGWYR